MPPPSSYFAGEDFLAFSLPDPDQEAQQLTRLLQVIFGFVFLLAPIVLGRLSSDDKDSTPLVARWLPRINLLGFLVAVGVIVISPHNIFTSRSVFVAPFLTPQECQSILEIGQAAAQRNIERHLNNTQLQKSPAGWNKARHEIYPTTDLNWMSDPFEKADRLYLAAKLHMRLAPLIQRIYGIVPASIRANDLFLVRYDAAEGQQALRAHTDESFVSFNVLMNDDFEGGGTRFHNRRHAEQVLNVHPDPGQVLISNAVIRHEGLPITQGTRYILVGFLSIDRTKPSSGAPTGLSWFASWLYLPWAQVRFKQGCQAMAQRQFTRRSGDSSETTAWTDNDLSYLWYNGMATLLEFLGDVLAPHKVHNLVHTAHTAQYLKAMDGKAPPIPPRRASWFQQQRLITDVDGRVVQQVNSDHTSNTPRGDL